MTSATAGQTLSKAAIDVALPGNGVSPPNAATPISRGNLKGKRVGMVLFSSYPHDPRPRRAIEALRKEGMTVDLLCLADDGAPRRETLNGVDVVRIPITQERGGKFSYAYRYSSFILISSAILAWRSLTRRYDLVYVHNMPDVLVISALFPKILGARVILDMHDPMPELAQTIFGLKQEGRGIAIIKKLEKWSFARADLVVTVNAACKEIFSTRSCSAEKIGVVMNSPDEGIFPIREPRSHTISPRTPDQPFVMMYHGSLVERNGANLAVEALAMVRNSVPNAELRIYGRKTPFLERIMEQTRQKNLENRVHYLGQKTLEQLVREIEKCDVGVIPNQSNVFTDINTPTRIFEYLALGKPVIAPSTKGIMDYFTDDSLLLVESGNAADIARQLEFAAHNYGQAIRIAERGQKVYLRHIWQQERETLLNLTSELLSKGEA